MNAKKKVIVSDDSLITRVVKSPRFLLYSILVHVVFVAVIVMSLDWKTRPKPPPHVIQATAVDESKIKAEMEKLRLADEKKKNLAAAQQKKLDDAKKASKREEKRLADLKKKREAERRKLKAEEKRRKAEVAKRKTEENKRKTEENKRKIAEKQRKAEEKKRLDAKKKRVAEEKRLKAQKQAQLEKLKAEEAALEAKMKKEEEARIRQQQLAEEQRRLDAAREREYQSIVDKHLEIIRQKVIRNWLQPGGSVAGLVCTVKVRIIPGGDVLDVRIIRSSGNAVFDRSVETAVLKASPMPLPADRALFDRFRDLEFVFDPED